MRRPIVTAALLSLVLSACASDRSEPEEEVLAEEVEPGIVVRTTRDADGNAVSTLADEVRNVVLASGRYGVLERRWEANVVDPLIEDFHEDLVFPPTLREMNQKLVTVWREVGGAAAEGLEPYDSPGCDYVPDTAESHCVQNCCATHDECYDDNDCGFTSWAPFVGTAECRQCNTDARQCVGRCAYDPPPCEESQCGCDQSACYDDDCEAGKDIYCAGNCNNGGAGPCRNPDPYPTEACIYANGATRLSLHGGAIPACVPWCENLGLGRASGWWYNEALWCCVCERAPDAPQPRETWPWLTKPWPYPIPSIHWREDGHWQPPFPPCQWYINYWLCG